MILTNSSISSTKPAPWKKNRYSPKTNYSDGTPASSSFILKNGEDGLSVDIEKLSTHEQPIQDPKRFRLFSLEAAHTVELGLTNEHDPIEGNYAHALIKGNISKGVARKLAAAARRINYPD
jgi:hypothetical protein